MISLILATWNRVDEVNRFLASLDKQSYRDIEVILVDQNEDQRLEPVVAAHPKLCIRHIRCQRGLSRARNAGLRIARGSFVAFPDDDCWYPEHLLASVVGWFDSHEDFDALFTIMRGTDGKPIGPKWPKRPCQCKKHNALFCTTSVNAFSRRAVVNAAGFFDENLGAGAATKYSAGEDTDYFLRLLNLGSRMWYEPSIWVGHDDLHAPERLERTSYPYGLSSGLVMRRHGYSWFFLFRQLMRSLGGAGFSLCKANLRRSRIYLIRASGQLRGYCLGPRELARASKLPTV